MYVKRLAERIGVTPATVSFHLKKLEEIAKSFEKGWEYTEREVNIIIAYFNDDFCTIRCDMISEGIITRENMIYKNL